MSDDEYTTNMLRGLVDWLEVQSKTKWASKDKHEQSMSEWASFLRRYLAARELPKRREGELLDVLFAECAVTLWPDPMAARASFDRPLEHNLAQGRNYREAIEDVLLKRLEYRVGERLRAHQTGGTK